MRQGSHREDVNAFDDGRLACVGLRNNDGADTPLARRQSGRESTTHRTNATIQRELPEKHECVEGLAEERPLATEDAQRHGQVKRRPFLANIRRGEVEGNALRRGEIKAAIFQGCLDAFTAFFHRDVRQTHHVEFTHFPRADIHLDFDEVGVNPVNSGAETLKKHGEGTEHNSKDNKLPHG